MGGLSSDQSELYLSHGLVSRFQHKLQDDQREKIDQEYYSSGLVQIWSGRLKRSQIRAIEKIQTTEMLYKD